MWGGKGMLSTHFKCSKNLHEFTNKSNDPQFPVWVFLIFNSFSLRFVNWNIGTVVKVRRFAKN